MADDEDITNYFKSLNKSQNSTAAAAPTEESWDDGPAAPQQTVTTKANDEWEENESKNDFNAGSSSNNFGSSSNNSYGGTSSTFKSNNFGSSNGGGSFGGSKAGDWKCSCGFSNFASRFSCKQCSSSKPSDAGGSGSGNNSSFGGGRDRAGDWKCSCGFSNFASRYSCKQCSSSKPGDAGSSNGNSFGGGRDRAGDWKCSCGFSNFASRFSCKQCSSSKPSDAGGSGSGNNSSFGGGRDRAGDWKCSCGFSNFASRFSCKQCSSSKPGDAGSSNGSSFGGSKPGDWKCSCGFSNFASRFSCKQCSSSKPEGAGNSFDSKRKNGDDWGNSDSKRFKNDGDKTDEKKREIYIPPPPSEDENVIFESGRHSGINIDSYNDIPVKVSEDAPNPIASFESAGFRDFVLENIKKAGYTQPTPIQQYGMAVIKHKRDLMACAQTGSGKTAAFMIPIVNDLLEDNRDMSLNKPHAVILSPTRELAQQIYEDARKFAYRSYLKVALLYGGTSVKYQAEQLHKGCHILVSTPGRLKDFYDRGWLSFEDVRYVVLDEADRMLDKGFKNDIELLMGHKTMNSSHMTLMFSATFPEEIQKLACQYLKDFVFIAVGVVGGACKDVEQNLIALQKFEKLTKIKEMLGAEDPTGTMIFCETKRNVDFLAAALSEMDLPATSIHGDRFQRERNQALGDFKSGKMKILVATSVAARGLDIRDVRHVINYDLPKEIDEYVHRIGRTGRVGRKGKATSFYDANIDSALAPDLVEVLKKAEQEVPDFLKQYDQDNDNSAPHAFGACDIRNNTANAPAAAAADEEECWD